MDLQIDDISYIIGQLWGDWGNERLSALARPALVVFGYNTAA